MIFIVIDKSGYEDCAVLGVFREHSLAEAFILSQDPEDLIDVVTWDIVKNQEVV